MVSTLPESMTMRRASTVEWKNSYDLTLHHKHGTQQLLTELAPNITNYFHEKGKKSFRFHMPIYRRQ